jgi:hypothetical protein
MLRPVSSSGSLSQAMFAMLCAQHCATRGSARLRSSASATPVARHARSEAL